MIPFSVLDLSPIPEGGSAGESLRSTLDLARHAEQLGYLRFWLAEHHNMPGIASAATAVVIGHVAAGTRTIRVGAGGIMLPNHAPLVIAEQFGTLESLHPGRIDLGLGRAPGTDPATAQALRRDLQARVEQFPQDVRELQYYFSEVRPGQVVRAYPGAALELPLWLLGSSLYSAQLAAALGLPFAFASHFAPAAMTQALAMYRVGFDASKQLDKPYAILCANVVIADTDEQAVHAFTSQQQAFVNLRRGKPGRLPAPVARGELDWLPQERAMVEETLAVSFVGSPGTVTKRLREFLTAHEPDELMVTAHIHNPEERLRSLELLAQVRRDLSRD